MSKWRMAFSVLVITALLEDPALGVRSPEYAGREAFEASQSPGKVRGQVPQDLSRRSSLIRIDRIEPREVECGGTAEITGTGFGALQGDKVILFMRDHSRHELRVLRWSEDQIRVEIPENANPGRYRVGICTDRRCREGSNAVPLSIIEMVGGMLIESAAVGTSTRRGTVDIRGVHFRSQQGTKVVAINHQRVNRMRVLRWSDRRVIAEIPPDLEPGAYRVLIYYDDSLRTSSNSVEVRIGNRIGR